LIGHVDFGNDIAKRLGLRMKSLDGRGSERRAGNECDRDLVIRFHRLPLFLIDGGVYRKRAVETNKFVLNNDTPITDIGRRARMRGSMSPSKLRRAARPATLISGALSTDSWARGSDDNRV
jgi:hypothetical protein